MTQQQLQPPPLREQVGSRVWLRWFIDLQTRVANQAQILWSQIDFTGSDHSDIETIGEADETSSDTTKDKHVSNNQLKANADRFTVVDGTTTLTAGASQIILADATLGAFTITLPSISAADKYRYVIKKIDSTSSAVTIAADGAETIDGLSTLDIIFQYDSMSLVPHGTEWSIV